MKYTVHRALAMLKTTKARIERELADECIMWARVARGNEDLISGVAVKDIERDIQSHYDRITALIENYAKIKSAVIKSNAGVAEDSELRRIAVCGKSLTVAEIIEMQDTIYGRAKKPGFKSKLLAKMKDDFAKAQMDFDDMQENTLKVKSSSHPKFKSKRSKKRLSPPKKNGYCKSCAYRLGIVLIKSCA